MDITANQLKGKPKKVGELDGAPVMQAETKGGFFILMTKSDGKAKTLGTGSHPAVAWSIAERDFPRVKLSELSKSEQLEPTVLRNEVKKWTPVTRFAQSLEK